MPVSTFHPEVLDHLAEWRKIEDCLAGEKAIKEAGTLYLPRSAGVDDPDYQIFKERASFFNATSRTHEAMLGFLFRKPPTVDLPDAMSALLEDADMTNAGLIAYSRRVAHQVCAVGRCGTLVEWADGESPPRPYFAFYEAGCIINWQVERIQGNLKLTGLVLMERTWEASDTDMWQRVLKTRYREIVIEGDRGNPATFKCAVTVWEDPGPGEPSSKTSVNTPAAAASGAPVISQAKTYLHRRNVPLDFIPFVFHNSEQPGVNINKAPMGDLSDVNISHYRSSADLENGRHFCGCPTPWARCFNEADDAGNKSGGDVLLVGSNVAWSSDNPAAMCGYLEFSGQGLGSLEKALEEKQQLMASLGARLIEPKTGDAKAYATVALEASAESSTLARIGILCSESMTEIIQIADWWMGSSDERDADLRFYLNDDFSSAAIQAPMATALMALWQSGAISQRTMMHNFRRGEMYEPLWTNEDELEAIEANPPMPTPANNPPPPEGTTPPGGKAADTTTPPKA